MLFVLVFPAINWRFSAVFPVVLGFVRNSDAGGVRRVAARTESRLHLLVNTKGERVLYA